MTIARYSTTNGLAGCYMPDNYGGPVEFTRRRDLVEHVRYEIEFMEWPAYLIRQVPFTRLWAHIKRYGSSTAHFSIQHNGYELAFHGLTDDEFNQMNDDE